MTPNQKAALERLIEITQDNSGQSATVADFLLAWWSAQDCGGFNLASFWSVETAIAADMIEVCRMIADNQRYPESAGYKAEFVAMTYHWRPALPGGSPSPISSRRLGSAAPRASQCTMHTPRD